MSTPIQGFSKLSKEEKIDWVSQTFTKGILKQNPYSPNIGMRTRPCKNYMMNLLKTPSVIFMYPLELRQIF